MHTLKVKGGNKMLHENGIQKKSFISDKIDFKSKAIKRDKTINGSVHITPLICIIFGFMYQ
jgi:hypothetical protein